MSKILVVDNETSIVTLLQFNLEQAGFTVVTAMDGRMGLQLIRKEKPDLIILDPILSKPDGMEIRQTIRQEGNNNQVLMLTKPFNLREVIGKAKAILE